MNHKRRRPKNARAGCLMCKPHKATWAGKNAWTMQEWRHRGAKRNPLREDAA